MKVSNDYPLLQKTNALLIVAGKQAAKIYRLKEGYIDERDTIEVETPLYTDREGHFEHRSGNAMFGSGSVYENKDQYIQTRFLKELVEHIKKITVPYDKIYLFSPGYILNIIKEALPAELKNKLDKAIDGNFTKHHPNDLLGKLNMEYQLK